MRAAQLVAPRKWELLDLEKPKATDGTMLVRLERVAICGTDKPSYVGLSPSYPLDPGNTGHEGLGIVESCPSGKYREGERVLLWAFDRGLFQEYVLARDEGCVRLPADGELNVILMSQLLGTVIHAFSFLPTTLAAKSTHQPMSSLTQTEGAAGSALGFASPGLSRGGTTVRPQAGGSAWPLFYWLATTREREWVSRGPSSKAGHDVLQVNHIGLASQAADETSTPSSSASSRGGPTGSRTSASGPCSPSRFESMTSSASSSGLPVRNRPSAFAGEAPT